MCARTLFNWLGQTLDGKRCLDLFSGSGALGFEHFHAELQKW
ncbi:MAG: RsmD family RNA methyltransferase [Nitrosomonadales bacterium]